MKKFDEFINEEMDQASIDAYANYNDSLAWKAGDELSILFYNTFKQYHNSRFYGFQVDSNFKYTLHDLKIIPFDKATQSIPYFIIIANDLQFDLIKDYKEYAEKSNELVKLMEPFGLIKTIRNKRHEVIFVFKLNDKSRNFLQSKEGAKKFNM